MATTKVKKPVTAKTSKTKATATKTTQTKKTRVSKAPIIVIIAALVLVASVVAAIIAFVVNKQPDVVGKYTLVSTVDANGEENTSMVSLFELFGAKYTVEFKKDKTGVMETSLNGGGLSSLVTDDDTDDNTTDNTALGNTVNFTYDDKTIKAKNDEGEVSESTYTYKDGVLTITMGDETMKFKRAE